MGAIPCDFSPLPSPLATPRDKVKMKAPDQFTVETSSNQWGHYLEKILQYEVS